ncbi:MotA/TolQ/ExbB proton channel family protein [Permianibacter aggregans]|uniref:Outer membrane transport energization protein ExbB n=1 Tax=Permianibacter aggregans TaxID=1510150 RepID=A0A4R6UKY4_9GAMM|nr:MotA/TolQ/ExbB proton channel family protein [Permianibacter aggregans]QGX38939.1 MotA/TolQ/ExbB proton channel family protein [Permianibacter aggregans]TDQ46816.1 outer membrane transport energization protein ExbB [Permianibacter aggregans]
MTALTNLWEFVNRFMETGGPVMWIIAFVLFVLWALIIERWLYLQFEYPKEARTLIASWHARQDTSSWQARHIRQAWLSQATERLNTRIVLIKTLVAICPLIGLLGTVWGMINVFEAMSSQGSGNARLMANGISMATMPTMAGMVAAISGLFVAARLEALARNRAEQLADSLPHH